jgi:lipid-binding SYLF domain-containing protein
MPLIRFATAGALTVALVGAAPLAAQTQAKPMPQQPMHHDQKLSDEAELIQDSIVVLNELTTAGDNGIPQYLLQRAEAMVVIPSLIKGGFIIGAKHGKGILSVRDRANGTWSAPAFVKLTGGSIGWQIGAESVDLVLLVMNRKGLDQLLEDKFTIGGSASVTAGPVGRSADAATNGQFNAELLAYSRARGIFAGAALEGGALHADDSDNEDFYGRKASLREIIGGSVGSTLPTMAVTWKTTVARIVATK